MRKIRCELFVSPCVCPLQSKSLNQDSGVLFSPPSIMKSTLGGSEMMMGDQEMDPLDGERVQVLPVNNINTDINLYYFTNNHHHHQQHHLSLNQQPQHVQPQNYHQSSSSNLLPVNVHSQSQLQQQQQQRSFPSHSQFYHSTPVPEASYPGVSGVQASSSVGRQGSSSNSSSSNNNRMNQYVLNKENLPSDDMFLMLRNVDEDLDLGGFQMSKSIFNQEQSLPSFSVSHHNHNHQQGHTGVAHNQNVKATGRSFGTSLQPCIGQSSNSNQSSQLSSYPVGGYFGFDRTNVMTTTAPATKTRASPIKKQHTFASMTPKVESLDVVYADSNSQASLPTNVSSPASTTSYFDSQQTQQSIDNGSRPMMEFLDLNDDYWLEFAQ